ncbi:MAG: ATP phosphoribosyltransferase regulatory subunit [Clostridiales bacterium]|nr:ATP phosphoribosyltransferase regulatory subunit [Clostridiales bacterium]
MSNYRFHTPDGLSDMLPEDCAAKRKIEKKLRTLFDSSGYQEIETPGIEFFDVFACGKFVSQENLYKMTDQEGRILALRYDGTVPAARLAATVLKDHPVPLRLSYVENMYRFRESGGGRQREFAQAGVELLGVSNAQADAEVIALSIASALEIGLTDLQIAIGQVDFFLGLMEEWGIAGEEADLISKLVDRKDSVMLEKMADRLNLDERDRETLLMIPTLFGTYETIDYLWERVRGDRARAALTNLRDVLETLEDYGYLKYVSLDMGMLRSLEYYTGMIFKGFTHEVGFPIISGGRYDRVMSVFGRDLAAVGFSIGITLCIAAMHRQGRAYARKATDAVIGYDNEPGSRKKAIEAARVLRKKKMKVILDCAGKDEKALGEYAKSNSIGQVIFIKADDGSCLEEETEEK